MEKKVDKDENEKIVFNHMKILESIGVDIPTSSLFDCFKNVVGAKEYDIIYTICGLMKRNKITVTCKKDKVFLTIVR